MRGARYVTDKQLTPVVATWDVKVNATSLNAIAGTPQTVTTTSTTVTQPSPTITLQCPAAPQANDYGWTPPGTMTVTGGTFTDTFAIPVEQQAISIQASYTGAYSNACTEEGYGG